jgi:hypothetical protein
MTPDELAAAIKAHPFSEVAPELMNAVTNIALSQSLPFTPVDTGLLRTSETTHIEQGGYLGFVSTDTPYAPFQSVEFFQLGAEASVKLVEDLMQKIGVSWLEIIARGG